MKYFLEEYGKKRSIKAQRIRFFLRNKALLHYRIVEEAKAALADIIKYQGKSAEMYKSTSKYEHIRINGDYREEQSNALERSQQKERENTNTNGDNITSSTKEEIDNLKKDFKYIKKTHKAITSQK